MNATPQKLTLDQAINLTKNLLNQNQLEKAEELIGKLEAAKVQHPEIPFLKGSCYFKQGKLNEAVTYLRGAIEEQPDNQLCYYTLGTFAHRFGLYDIAAKAYEDFIARNDKDALAHFSLGSVYMQSSRKAKAVDAFSAALEIKPDLNEARIGLAISSFRPGDLKTSIDILEKVELPKGKSRAQLAALYILNGQPDEAVPLIKELEDDGDPAFGIVDAAQYMKLNEEGVVYCQSTEDTLSLAMKAAPKKGLFLEFGVRFGQSIRHIASLTDQPVHGFDSFEGLPESWHKEAAGSYSTEGVLPTVPENVSLHQGWFEDSLPKFLAEHEGDVAFMNVDCDLYSSTKTVLDALHERIKPGTVICFDEYVMNPKWREDEYKAFQEAVKNYGWDYEYLAFAPFEKQAVVKIL